MNVKKALELAVEALDKQAHETYEGDEYDDPHVQSFVNEKLEAIKEINTLIFNLP